MNLKSLKFRVRTPEIRNAEWSVTDILASFRTILANERTVLSYVRTALTLFGWIFIPTGIITVVIGIYRYNREKYLIHQVSHRKAQIREVFTPGHQQEESS
jgi:uncharacterized membrane protein YidH (DUF202 family)